MVIEYWGSGPSAADLAWVDPALADPCVDHAARFTFDAAYDGTGNWPFNTAYAAHFGLDAFVTRLRSLAGGRAVPRRGHPARRLDRRRAGRARRLPAAAGHGRPSRRHRRLHAPRETRSSTIPAAPSNDAVRRSYDRAQFERVWLEGSGGAVYVITPPGTALPPSPGNW